MAEESSVRSVNTDAPLPDFTLATAAWKLLASGIWKVQKQPTYFTN